MGGGTCAVAAGEAGQTTCRKKLTAHVRKIQEEREEAPVQGICEADEAGEEAGQGRPRPRRQLQEDRGAAGKVALDRARRGREAPLRLAAEGAGRGACDRRGTRGCMPPGSAHGPDAATDAAAGRAADAAGSRACSAMPALRRRRPMPSSRRPGGTSTRPRTASSRR